MLNFNSIILISEALPQYFSVYHHESINYYQYQIQNGWSEDMFQIGNLQLINDRIFTEEILNSLSLFCREENFTNVDNELEKNYHIPNLISAIKICKDPQLIELYTNIQDII